MDSLDEGKKKQERAIKKGREAELHSRKLEVSLNEIRRERLRYSTYICLYSKAQISLQVDITTAVGILE